METAAFPETINPCVNIRTHMYMCTLNISTKWQSCLIHRPMTLKGFKRKTMVEEQRLVKKILQSQLLQQLLYLLHLPHLPQLLYLPHLPQLLYLLHLPHLPHLLILPHLPQLPGFHMMSNVIGEKHEDCNWQQVVKKNTINWVHIGCALSLRDSELKPIVRLITSNVAT